jgi:hypothetical protein
MKAQKIPNRWHSFEQEEQTGSIRRPDFKTYYQAKMNKTTWY